MLEKNNQSNREMRRILITFDTHTPYLAFRVSALQRAIEERGLSETLKIEVVLIALQEASYGWSAGDLDKLYGGAPVTILSDAPFRGLGMKTFLQPGVWKTSLAMAKTVWRMKPALAFVGGYDRLESLTVMALSKLLRFRVGPLHDSRFNDAESFAKSIRLEWVKSLFMARYDFFMCPGKECIEYSRFLGGANKPAYRAGWNVVDNDTIAKSAADATHDDEIREHLQVPPGKRFFLMPIRFIEKKNALRVIEAFAASTKKVSTPAHLTICGKGEQEEALHKAAAASGAGEHITITGWLPYEQVPRACRLAEATVLASTHDQWGLIINEALAAGSPILVSDRCGAQELVKNYVNGFTFAPEDTAHLSELFRALADDESLVARFRTNAAKSMEEFSGTQFVEAVFKEIDRIG